MRRPLTIRRKLIFAFIAIIIPFVLLQVYTYQSRLASRRLLLLQAEIQRSNEIGHEFDHFVVNLRREAHAAGLAMAEDGNVWSAAKARGYLRELRRDYKSIEFMAWASPDGNVTAIHPSVASRTNITDRDYYKRIIRGQTWALSDLLISKAGGAPRFLLAYGVRDRSRSLKGILIAVVDPSLLERDLTLVNINPGSTAIITDSTGRIVYHTRYPDLPWKDRDWSRVPSVKDALQGRWAYDYRTHLPLSRMDLIGAQTPIESLGWTAGAYRPLQAAMAPVVEDFYKSLLLSIVIAVIVLAAVLVMGNRFSRPIVELANAAVEIARGKLSRRVSIHTRDEIQLLAGKFNLMAETLEQIQSVAGQALAETPLDDVLRKLVRAAAALMRTEKAAVLLYDPPSRRMRHAASLGLSEDYISFTATAPASVSVCGRASFSRHAEIVEVSSDPQLSAYSELMRNENIGYIVCVPLLVAPGQVLGALAGYFAPDDTPEEEQLSSLQFLATQAAVALENAQLHDETARRAQELQILWEVGQAVATKLDLDDLAATLAERLSALVRADDCCLVLYDREAGEISSVGKSLPLSGAVCPTDRASRCAGIVWTSIDTGRAAAQTLPPGDNDPASETAESILSVPMALRGQTIGSICLFKKGEFQEGDVRLASSLAGVAAIAVENARSYTKERRIAETLQSSFLTPMDFTDPSVEIAEIYRPAFEEANIGGDFFDIVRLPGDRFAIVIADVAGKGLRAAVHTAMVKYMLQAYAHQGQSPWEILTNLNAAVAGQLEPDSFVTLFLAILDPCVGRMVYANAGHEMPILRRDHDTPCELLDVTGPALGAIENATYSERTLLLTPGCMLALYTDGISEARANGEMFGFDGIRRVLERRDLLSARSLADAIVEAALDHAGGRLRDDVAILTLRFTGSDEPRPNCRGEGL